MKNLINNKKRIRKNNNLKRNISAKKIDNINPKHLPKWLKNDIDNEILNKKYSNINEILKKLKKIIYKNNPSDRTISWRYSLVKKYLSNFFDDPYFINKIKPKDGLTNKIIEMNINKRDNIKLITIDDNLINRITSFENSMNPYELYIYLLFVSGRRLREIKNAEFINKKNSNKIIMKGVSKKRGNDNKIEFIPLVSKSKFFRIYKRLKKIMNNISMKYIDRNLQRNIKNILGIKYKSHDLRKLYGLYSYKFRNKDDLSLNPFLKKYLNHDSINSSLHYTNMKFNFHNDIVK